MKSFVLVLVSVVAFPFPVICAANNSHETPVDKAVLGSFLKEHCIRCHGAEKQKAKLRFDELDFSISDNGEALHYQDVLDVLNSGEMPPEDEPQPTRDELEVVIGELTEDLFEARKRLASTGGKVEMRRLNRREYAKTIDHLFGFVPVADKIPQDGDVENFDTVGSRQNFTTENLDQYYELAREILTVAFKWAGKREAVKTEKNDPETFWNNHFRHTIAQWEGQTGKVVRISATRKEYLARPMVESGVYLDNAMGHLSFKFPIDPRATYRLGVVAGLEGNVAPVRRFIRVGNRDGLSAVLHISGTTQNPTKSVVEMRPVALRDGMISGKVGEDKRDNYTHYVWLLDRLEGIPAEENDGIIWIDSFQIEGPFYPEERSFFDALLCPGEPTPEQPAEMVWNDENADELISRFTHEAFRRREVDPAFLEGLAAYFRSQREKGSDFTTAMIDTLAVVLASPGFVFLNEAADTREDPRSLSARDSAIRLSYFLTSGPPDDDLYAAVGAGAMNDRDRYHAEVRRVLEKNSRTLAEGFVSQWADFVRFDSISVGKGYPTFNNGMRFSMKKEAIAFFQTLIDENLPISNLVQSDFATVNAQLATHYGIPGVTTNEFEKVSLPAGDPRGGFLTQGAFLVAGSNGERSSPTIRGMMVMNRLLNSPPPPPPPNVPELGSDADGPLTNRQLVELHQSQVQCASCHNKMDSIGLALENFDTIGRWRDLETVEPGKEAPIEISGALPGGDPFASFTEFQSRMLTHEEDLARAVVEALLVYGLGRDIEFTDEPHIDSIIEKTRPHQFRAKDLIHAVAESPLFFLN